MTDKNKCQGLVVGTFVVASLTAYPILQFKYISDTKEEHAEMIQAKRAQPR